jgi:hypothetical protein
MMGSCRFCGSRGHNRNGCPDVAAHAASGKAKMEEGQDRYSLGWKERFAVSIVDNKATRSARVSTTPRKCSYCSVAGHTRAKCETLTNDRAAVFNHEKTFRTNFANWVLTSGIGVGSIVTRKNWDGTEWSVLLTKVNYDGINIMNPNGQSPLRGQYLNRQGWENDVASLSIAPKRYFGFEISAPAPAIPVPDSFLNDEEITKTVSRWFDEKSSRRTRWHDVSVGIFHENRPDLVELTEKAKVYAV